MPYRKDNEDDEKDESHCRGDAVLEWPLQVDLRVNVREDVSVCEREREKEEEGTRATSFTAFKDKVCLKKDRWR